VGTTPRGAEIAPGTGVWLAVAEGAAHLTLARSEQRNTLDSRAFAALAEAVRHVDRTPEVHGIVLRSTLPGVFCSGGSYVDRDRPGAPSPLYGPQLTACFDRWTGRRVPVISVVDGAARAFGAALALTSDITIATPSASFGLPELSRGVVPSFAIALLGTRHPSRLVRELTLTTAPLTAEQAALRGLITGVVPDLAAAELRAQELLDLWSRIGAAAVRDAMRTLDEIDRAPDEPARRRIAVAGVEDQLRRFRAGQTDQRY
jgi:enoyl-CoA hydratase/carnithine racemase